MSKRENKNVIYIFLMGEYEDIKEPLVITPGWDYVCFTDNTNLKSEAWDIRGCLPEYASEKDFKRKAMIHMIEYYKLFDKDYENIITIPAGALITSDLDEFIKEIDLNERDMAILKHPDRKCVYKEAKVVINQRLDYRSVVNAQVKRYKEDNYPQDNGLWCTAVMVRNNQSCNLKKACEIWAAEYKQGSRRDQISLNYSFWKAKQQGLSTEVLQIPYRYANGRPFLIKGHKNNPGRQVKQ